MEQTVFQKAAEQGLWALLFVALLWWVLRTNAQREQRYLAIIQALGDEIKDRLARLPCIGEGGSHYHQDHCDRCRPRG